MTNRLRHHHVYRVDGPSKVEQFLLAGGGWGRAVRLWRMRCVCGDVQTLGRYET